MTEVKKASVSEYDFLIRGSDLLARNPDFKLVGRDEKLNDLAGVLLRSKQNSVIIVGPGGSGCSALCMGLQTAKEDPNMPFDIVSKRLYWLDIDGLFSSSDVSKNFQKIMATLERQPDTVLLIDDMKDFVDGARNSGNPQMLNAIMQGVKDKKFQAILESRDEDLGTVLKTHSDMQEFFTIVEVDEPGPEALAAIVDVAAGRMEKHHGIKISPEARATAIELTNKYRAKDPGLNRAQPERAITLIDRALTTYRMAAHARAPELDGLEASARAVKEALVKGVFTAELEGKSKEELETLQATLASDMAEVGTAWKKRRDEMKRLYDNQRQSESKIAELNKELSDQLKAEADARKEAADIRNKDKQSRLDKGGKITEEDEAKDEVDAFHDQMALAGHDSEETAKIREKIAQREKLLKDNADKYKAMVEEANKGLLLGRELVMGEFSDLSGIPVAKLTKDERSKLRALEGNLNARVFQQEHATKQLANAVKSARTGQSDPNKPQASFLFLGPSGVGKTELAKAVTAELFDDERAMLRFDMSEYQDKISINKLIGAPPGYEGFEQGGILTNAMRKNPRCVILFDEIEKAHPDIFTLFLQILDDARATDNHGRTVSFADAVIIMTTNIGTEHFLNENMSFEESRDLAMEELAKNYRPELLNRFEGRRNIVCFNRLNNETIEKIARREIDKTNKRNARQGLSVLFPEQDMHELCRVNYVPLEGARGVVGYLNANLKPAISDVILDTPDAKGVMKVHFDAAANKLIVDKPVPAVPANDSKPGAAAPPSAKNAFKVG